MNPIEPTFNNALEADAHNWDTRELIEPQPDVSEEAFEYIMVYSCTACGQVFNVPWFPPEDALPPEMIKVLEHEEAHTENGEVPGWDLNFKVKEEVE